MSQVLSHRRSSKNLKRRKRASKESAKSRPSIIGPGNKAPEFSLYSTPDQKVSLSDFKGRPVVLAFYPADWSPVCTDQLSLYNQLLPEFERYNRPEILVISVDGILFLVAYAKDRTIR